MKRFVLLLAASATMVIPAAPAFAASAASAAPNTTAQIQSVSKIPPELCFAFFGSDLENLVCSSR
ncbi:MAG TPA: hypothetical protein VFE55_04660 [Acidimicrobiia bacterium]|nr:hypothetical protein [Acidimicrobiia bacterium]